MNDTVWIYPGSFDPVTKGHLNIIERAAALCGRLIVGVLENNEKTSLFSAAERVNMLEKTVEGLDNVSVESFSGLQVDFYKKVGAGAAVRGIRDSRDYEYELSLSNGIKLLYPSYEVVFLATEPGYRCISSSMVRELGAFGGELKAFVPDYVAAKVMEKFKENYLWAAR